MNLVTTDGTSSLGIICIFTFIVAKYLVWISLQPLINLGIRESNGSCKGRNYSTKNREGS